MTTNIRNDEQVNLLSADFQLRSEPNFAWKSMVSQFLTLPALRGCWSMSSVSYVATSRVPDLSGQGNTLGDGGAGANVLFGYNVAQPLIPVAYMAGGAGQYLARADGGAGNWADITGTEPMVLVAQRGLTLGGWFLNTVIANTAGYMTKGTAAAAASSYEIFHQAAGTITFRVSNGVVYTTATSTAATLANTWQFVVGRFIPSTSVDIFIDNVITSQVVGVPAAIQDSAQPFQIGAFAGPILPYTGYFSIGFLCACALPNSIISALWHQTRTMFNRT